MRELTAKEAKKLTEAYRKNYIKSEYKRVCNLIKEAIKSGKDYIYINTNNVDNQILNTLISLGYYIDEGIISW